MQRGQNIPLTINNRTPWHQSLALQNSGPQYKRPTCIWGQETNHIPLYAYNLYIQQSKTSFEIL